MILDRLLCFSTPSTPQVITATAVSTDVIDLLNPRDMGIGDNPALKVAVWITAAFTAAGAATMQIAFQGAPDNGSGAPGTFVDYALSPLYAVADLTIGRKLFPIDVPGRHANMPATFPRFYRLNYTVATGPMLTGSLFAAIVLDNQASEQYPAGLVISN